ncbi:MAG TPA: GGDEF domain-containing protein, partial [Desulfuromonadales bacterium]|nr:GGDEF domain-containing protein [Desulfuromonadales bacterium]
LEQAIAKSRRYDMKFGLLYLDLDYFKKINDTLGHEAGDEVLIEASDRIRSCCKRDLDTISRQGGDEFCIIVTDCGGTEQLDGVATNLLKAFGTPFTVNGSEVTVTTSIGISIFPDDGTEPKELEVAADKAMYAAKRSGRNARAFYKPHPLQ